MDPNPNPSDDAPPHERLAALALRRDLPPDFAGAEIDNDAEAKDDDDEDEGYLTAVSRGGSSTCAAAAWREAAEGLEEDKDGEDIAPPSPSSSGYAGERGSSLASSGGIEEPDPEPDGVGVQDWARDKKHVDEIVFLVKGPIYLVCISCTEESYDGLRGQLELMYGQILLILTKSVNRCFEKNPKFDMAPLLGGTDAVFLSLIHAFNWNPATFLHAYTCLPLAQSTRQAASAVLQDIADSGVLFALLMCEHKEHTYVTLLTTRSDAFYDLQDSRARIQNVLLKSNVLIEVQRSLRESALHVEDLPTDPSPRSEPQPSVSSQDRSSRSLPSEMAIGGPAGLWHFIYKSIYLDQYVSSEFLSPISNPKQQKRLYKAYKRLYASMHDKATGPHKTQFRRDEDYGKLTDEGGATNLNAVSLAYGLALTVAMSVGANISGGHVNPAVTCSAPWLPASSSRSPPGASFLSAGVGPWNAVVLEMVTTFGLVYTVYATAVDPRNKQGEVGVIAIGFIVGANILAGGPFAGAAIAALIYDIIFIGQRHHD
ncbi:hypothetical protein PR202_gb03591 [Eleusine coracana subsp. coracana]|uniref:Vacuolar fusion protein MON1 homolog n=1 Tax=Eleusine coracana subsp. coracana TaxID=191504 RepID=A0AAV5DZU4_ELECO|nr:hypothetical protein PR202_gb03591 [Eleusine coracana subsp. coracana]